MPDRSVEEIRREIAAQRQRLGDDLDALNDEVRSVVPVVLIGLIASALVFRDKRLLTSGLKVLAKIL
jgi:hypothetical protein